MTSGSPGPGGETPHPLAALFAFWAEAGVDLAYAEAPQDRLAEGAQRLQPRPPEALVRPAPPRPAATGPDDGDLPAMARAEAEKALDIAALDLAVSRFPFTGPRARGGRAIFARGPADAAVMLIGEAPGAEEDEGGGQPFAGRSGRLLDRMLAAAGLEGGVFITNTIFWRPGGDRAPSPAEQAMCLPFLERAIALVRPQALLLAGGASAKAMLGRSEGIVALRGRWSDWTPPGGGAPIPALPMLHPAFLLRQPAAKAQAWADILTLMSRLDPSG